MVVAQLPPKETTYKRAISREPWLMLLVLVLGGTLGGFLASQLLRAIATGVMPVVIGGAIILVAIIIFGSAFAKIWLWKPNPPDPPWLLPLLLAILCISFSGPVLLLYWLLRPEHYKKAIQTSVFLLSLGAALLYIHARSEEFKTLAEKIGFLSAVCLGPPTALDFMI